ncbi:hypothetical protein M8542_46980 [Amycolatopsis sp. OK19-0408]|uniref:Uncharacterized protein n=1 Tax=Amycolatopsis iheyensis TaxID=2945988 RepID=A0A9X2SRD7_9PSEU|nr:hypothetical protein [Amycolatopsis iheyensis]MCR6490376.1 hypothetical protein [Amycolatopsis iheyensis]
MARRAPRGEQVTVAELLVRSAPVPDRYRTADTHARHREKPQVLRSLARLRVLSVVAGALALTGGVATAVSMPVQRSGGAVWPPVGLEPPAVALVPLPAKVSVPPAKPAPESVTPPAGNNDIPPAAAVAEPNSGTAAVHRGNLAKAVKIIGKVKPLAKLPKPPNPEKVQSPPKKAAPVRHEIPDFALWWRGWAGGQDRPIADPGRRDTGHHGCGGGRHRR